MSFEQKEGFGALFKNEKKEDGDNRPNYQGNVKVGGVEYRLAAWLKDGPKGKYMSLKAEPAQEQSGGQSQARDESRPDDLNDMPF